MCWDGLGLSYKSCRTSLSQIMFWAQLENVVFNNPYMPSPAQPNKFYNKTARRSLCCLLGSWNPFENLSEPQSVRLKTHCCLFSYLSLSLCISNQIITLSLSLLLTKQKEKKLWLRLRSSTTIRCAPCPLELYFQTS